MEIMMSCWNLSQGDLKVISELAELNPLCAGCVMAKSRFAQTRLSPVQPGQKDENKCLKLVGCFGR